MVLLSRPPRPLQPGREGWRRGGRAGGEAKLGRDQGWGFVPGHTDPSKEEAGWSQGWWREAFMGKATEGPPGPRASHRTRDGSCPEASPAGGPAVRAPL